MSVRFRIHSHGSRLEWMLSREGTNYARRNRSSHTTSRPSPCVESNSHSVFLNEQDQLSNSSFVLSFYLCSKPQAFWLWHASVSTVQWTFKHGRAVTRAPFISSLVSARKHFPKRIIRQKSVVSLCEASYFTGRSYGRIQAQRGEICCKNLMSSEMYHDSWVMYSAYDFNGWCRDFEKLRVNYVTENIRAILRISHSLRFNITPSSKHIRPTYQNWAKCLFGDPINMTKSPK